MFISKFNFKMISTKSIAVDKLALFALVIQTRAYLAVIVEQICAAASANELLVHRKDVEFVASRFDVGNGALQMEKSAALSIPEPRELRSSRRLASVSCGAPCQDRGSTILSMFARVGGARIAESYRTELPFCEPVSVRSLLTWIFSCASQAQENARSNFAASPVSAYSYSLRTVFARSIRRTRELLEPSYDVFHPGLVQRNYRQGFSEMNSPA